MAEVLINSAESNTHADGLPDPEAPSSDGSVFHRRIEFHNARKQFTGFSNGGGDFKLETLNPNLKPQIFSSGSSAIDGRKPNGSEILENGFDPELNFRITFRRIGAGLENLGYTCFLNSVLQCLTYTEPLAAYLLSGRHQISCRTAGFCALCAIQKHVSRALQSTGRILAPKELVANLRCISRSFRNSRQEDAHEYMVNLLESMHRCCLPSGVPIESPSAHNKSLVHKIFGGRLRSQVKCMQCSFCSNKFDPFLDLSLEIAKAESLYKALAHFTTKEQLDGGERHYQCQQCKQKVKALKQLTIHSAPDVLAIHLKRFDSHVPGEKIDKKILFGSTLDLKPFVTGPYDGDLRYTLYAVLVHAGWSTHSGHYYCFVSPSRGMWYCLDDHQIVQVNERKVLEQKAYMLLYSRDNKNFTSKKPMDVQKENMAINAIGRNIVYSNFNEGLNETIHDGPIEKRLHVPNSSAAISQRDASKETINKEASIQKMNGLVMAECSSLNKDHLLECFSKLLPQSVSSVKASNGSLKLDNAVTTTTAAKMIKCGENSTKKGPSDSVATSLNCNQESTKKDLSDSIDKPPKKNLNNSIDISPKKDLTDSNKPPREDPSDSIDKPHKKDPSDSIDKPTKKVLSGSIDRPPNCSIPHISPGDLCMTEKSSGQNGDKASAPDFSGKTLEKNDPVISLCQISRDYCQTGGFSLASAGGDSLGEQSGDHVQRTVDFALTELSSLPITRSISLQKKTLDRKPHQKIKKKILKGHITSMHLSSNILFGTSSRLLKKKKNKRSKGIKNLSWEHFLGDSIPTDPGPSTSEKFRTVPCGGSAHSRRKGVNSGSKKKEKSRGVKNIAANSNGELSTVDKEFRERTAQNGSVLAADDLPQKHFTTASEGNQLDARESCSSEDSRRRSMQNGLMSMLTRGLEDTIVARWDERESYPSRVTESSGVESVSIGYVADEWDEEYDRGKRKKVRSSKNTFGGQNPFQEIATSKAKLKKAKMAHSSSGNQPFRI